MFDSFKKVAHVVAGVVGKAMGVKIVFGQGGPSTDGEVIHLPSEIQPPEAGIGFTIHEGAHIAHTDMEVFRDFAKRGEAAKSVLNILEDVRIERRVCRRYRGARKRLNEAAESLDWADKPTGQASDVFNWLLFEARRHDQESLFGERAKAFRQAVVVLMIVEAAASKIEGLVAQALDAPDTKATAALAEQILDILKDQAPDSGQSGSDGQNQDGQQDHQEGGQGDAGDDESSDGQDQSPAGSDEGDGQGKSGQGDEGDGSSGNDTSADGPGQSQSGQDYGQGQNQAEQGEGDAEGSSQGAADAQGQPGGAGASPVGLPPDELDAAASGADTDVGERLKQKLIGGRQRPLDIRTLPEQPMDGHTVPIDSALVAKAAERLRARMQAFTRQRRALKDVGHEVATDRLACLRANDPYIFRRDTRRRGIDATCVILLDASGSMHRDDRDALAGQAATVIHNALLSLNRGHNKVESRVVGFTDCLFTAPPNRRMHRAPKLAYSATPTASAIVQVLPDMVLSRRRDKVLFVVTDGQPDNPGQTREVIEAARAEGYKVFSLIVGVHDANQFKLAFVDPVACPDAKAVPEALAEAVGKAFNL